MTPNRMTDGFDLEIMVSLFPQSKIEHLEELVRSSQEEAQSREDEYTADLSETKELLEELRHSVKVTFSA